MFLFSSADAAAAASSPSSPPFSATSSAFGRSKAYRADMIERRCTNKKLDYINSRKRRIASR